MIITLTGFMGSGKSSVGRELSALLSWEYVDLDQYIVHKMGQSIPEIFKEGEERFRAIEEECLRDLVVMKEVAGGNMVISLGGGTITIGSARTLILEHTECVYLLTDLDSIFERLGHRSKSRPLFQDSENVENLMDARAPIYEMAPHHVSTDGKTPAEIAREIAGLLL